MPQSRLADTIVLLRYVELFRSDPSLRAERSNPVWTTTVSRLNPITRGLDRHARCCSLAMTAVFRLAR